MVAVDTELAVLSELLVRYGRAISREGWLLVALVSSAALVFQGARLPLRYARISRRVAVTGLVAAGSIYAWSLIWAADDAYISFRYAENLVRGTGLVYNPGERVEGYTDFLWTLISAGFIGVGLDPGQAAILLCLASFAAVVVLVARMPQRLTAVPLIVGPAPILCALNYTMASFATAGLETMFAALLVLVAVERVESRHSLAGGLAAIAATMSHPDHAIFYVALGAALALDRTRRRELASYLGPFVFVFVPYFLWRWAYYGDWVPNTYYAKSAGRAYFEQGGIYCLATFVGGGVILSVPLAVFGALRLRHTTTGRFGLLGVPLYLGYVAKIGGDFMLGRLFVPALVFVFLFADVGFRLLIENGRKVIAACLVVPAALAALPIRILKHGEIFHGIADERTYTPVTNFSKMVVDASGYVMGHALFRAFAGRPWKPKVGITSIGMAGYYSRIPIFDLRGLTSPSVAHLPLKDRGRPGHEKFASPGHVVEAGVALSQDAVYPPPYDSVTRANVGGFPFYLVHYSPPIVRRLHEAHADLFSVDRLESSFGRFDGKPPDVIECHLWFLREYYFSSNRDLARSDRIVRAATLADENLKPVESLLLDDGELAQQGFVEIRTVEADPNAPGWDRAGSAWEWTHAPLLPEQGLPIGAHGPILNTGTQTSLDEPTGSLTSAPFTIDGDMMTFEIAGGRNARSLSVSLVVDGNAVRRATGCQTEWLGRRFWDLRPFRGKEARIAIVDDSGEAWGHLVLGALTEWRAPPSAAP